MSFEVIYPPKFRINYWEYDWLSELTSNFLGAPQRELDISTNFTDGNKVLIVSNNSYYNFLMTGVERNNKYIIIRTSDEALIDTHPYITHKNILAVFRNYLSTSSSNEKLYHFGLGYRSGLNILKANIKKLNERRYLVNFIGSIHKNHESRQELYQLFKKFEKGFFHFTDSFNDPNYISIYEYGRVLRDSAFTLCPSGSINFESFRLHEALASGSIPILIDEKNSLYKMSDLHYWSSLFADTDTLPFLKFKSWGDAFNFLEGLNVGLLENIMQDKAIAMFRMGCSSWMEKFSYKLKIMNDL